MTLGRLIQSANSTLTSQKVTQLDIEWLLINILDCNRVYLYTHRNQKINQKKVQQFHNMFRLRKTGMPIAYILKHTEFYGHKFIIKPGVFIPRPDTETLVSAVINQWDKSAKLNIIDFGCGSGCVGLSLLKHFVNAKLIAIDSNQKALDISRINAKNNQVENRVTFLNKDISKLNNIDKNKIKCSQIDLIVANPPYISFNDSRVEKDVIFFEPAQALFSQNQGLYHIKSWFYMASCLLKPGGNYLFEIGEKQNISFLQKEKNKMRKLAEFKDLSAVIRVVQFQKYHG